MRSKLPEPTDRLLDEYAGCEVLDGRMRAPVPIALFMATGDLAGHDRDDEDRDR